MSKYLILNAFDKALEKSGISKRNVCIVSDVFYPPEAIKPLGIDFFHINRGRSIAFATGLKLGNPQIKVVAFSGDLATLGGNHIIHASRKNMDIIAICINNFIYPGFSQKHSTKKPKFGFSVYSNFERPFNMPHLAKSCGATFVARWTAKHTKHLSDSITKALQKNGFSVIEVLSPGCNYFAGIADDEEKDNLLQYCYEHSQVNNNEDTKNLEINGNGKIIVGEFVEKERPTFLDMYNERLTKVLGDKFEPYGGKSVRD